MAQGYFEKRLKELGREDIEVSSAGVIPLEGMQATEEAQKVMKEEGIDISGHRTKMITEYDMRDSDLIFVMEERHKQYVINKYPKAAKKIYLLKDFKRIGNLHISENPDIPDPITKDVNFYKETFSVIKEAIERILKEIK